MRIVAAAGLLVLVASCGRDLFAPMPAGAVQISPPPQFAGWYRLAEQCSGGKGDFARVRWYRYFDSEVAGASGRTWHREHKIALGRSAMRAESVTVMHESLHDIHQVSGHPAKIFGTPPLYLDSPCGPGVGLWRKGD